MSVIGSCGHELELGEDEFYGVTLEIKSYARDFGRSVDVITVCKECSDWYEQEGLILYNSTQEELWMSGKLPYEKVSEDELQKIEESFCCS